MFRGGAARLRREVAAALAQGWAALVPLVALPLVEAVCAAHPWPGRAAALAVAALLWAGTLAGRDPGPRALFRPGVRTSLGAWELALLLFVGAASLAYLAASLRLGEIAYNDGAYYYGVARHMARTGRFEEPIVWHFLHPPGQVRHAPFDYWGPITSLLLVPPLALFGATPRTAFVSMAVVSAAAMVAFWYLVCFALPLRQRVAQMLALAVFAFSPAMDVYRFQPESTSIAQVFLLGALIALCRGRAALAVPLAFGVFLARSDGLVLFALLVLAALLVSRTRPGPARRWAPLAIAVACVCAYAMWSWVSFGSPLPPGPRRLPALGVYWRVFDYAPPRPAPAAAWPAWTSGAYVLNRLGFGVDALRAVPFAPAMQWWLGLALVPICGLVWRRDRRATLVWLVGVLGFFGLVIVSGPGFYVQRAPHTFAPLVVLAGAMGVDLLLSALHVALRRRRGRLIAGGAGTAVVVGCAALLLQVPVLRSTVAPPNLPHQSALAALSPVLEGGTVATNVPWYVMAYTDSPTVSVPFNGEAALAAVLERYDARWLVVFGDPPYWVRGASLPVLQAIRAGTRLHIGDRRLERVPLDLPVDLPAAAYRVLPPDPPGVPPVNPSG